MKSRVAYRAGTMTAKTLAEHLRARCMKEWKKTTADRPEKFSLSVVHKDDDGSAYFQVTKTILLTEAEMRRLNTMEGRTTARAFNGWTVEWTAEVRVAHSLDIDISDVFGRADLEALERSALACALRGPER